MARNFVSGSTQYLENANAVVAAYPFTMACWFKSTDTANDQALMCLGQVANADDSHVMFAAGNVASDPVKIQTDSGGGLASAVSSTGYSSGVAAHACGVFAGAADRRAYINGGSKGTSVTNQPFPATLTRTSIGRLTLSASARFLTADVWEAAIWSVALDDDEVAALGKGFCPLLIRPASLVAYWPLYGNDSPEPDRWKSKFDMTLNNTPIKADHQRVIYPGQVP